MKPLLMKRLLIPGVVTLVALSAASVQAEVKTREKTQFKLEGMLGRLAGMFGGKAAKEGVVSTTAVKGDRKATMNESNGRIVDLSEEKVYDIDMKKKTYEVTTFEELRRRMREAQEKAERETQKEPSREPEPEKDQPPAKQVEFDFDVKETGQKKSLAGYDTRQVIMTLTVREKGKTLEDGGGMVITSDSWLAPRIPAMKELTDFELRYWKAIAPETAGLSPEMMATIMAMYPMLKGGMERLQQEGGKLDGTALATTTVFEGVKSKEQMAQAAESSGGSGLGGMLARRMKKDDGKARSTILTLSHEFQEVAPTAAPADLEVPAGFKQKS